MSIHQQIGDLIAGRHTETGDELDAGAQLIVTDPDGTEAFRAALARHWRIDDADPQLIWIRPILGGYHDRGAPAFSLNLARRRALAYTRVRRSGDGVILHLRNGQTAEIRPAAGRELAELQRWDTFYLWVLTADETAELDRLDHDSWHGRFT